MAGNKSEKEGRKEGRWNAPKSLIADVRHADIVANRTTDWSREESRNSPLLSSNDAQLISAPWTATLAAVRSQEGNCSLKQLCKNLSLISCWSGKSSN